VISGVDDREARVILLAGSGVVGASISRIVVSTSIVVLIVVRSVGVGICTKRRRKEGERMAMIECGSLVGMRRIRGYLQ
jgi:hypothetical protein